MPYEFRSCWTTPWSSSENMTIDSYRASKSTIHSFRVFIRFFLLVVGWGGPVDGHFSPSLLSSGWRRRWFGARKMLVMQSNHYSGGWSGAVRTPYSWDLWGYPPWNSQRFSRCLCIRDLWPTTTYHSSSDHLSTAFVQKSSGRAVEVDVRCNPRENFNVVKVDGGFHSQKVAICKAPW